MGEKTHLIYINILCSYNRMYIQKINVIDCIHVCLPFNLDIDTKNKKQFINY